MDNYLINLLVDADLAITQGEFNYRRLFTLEELYGTTENTE